MWLTKISCIYKQSDATMEINCSLKGKLLLYTYQREKL